MVIGKSQFDIIKNYFPYEPYKPQAQYMQDVFDIIEKGKIGLLEAPSGFGKTSALLASTVILPDYRVYYYSRTHAQMKQVAQELERINEKSDSCFTCVVRGSRKQLCLDENLMKMRDHRMISEICYSRIKRTKENLDSFEEFYSNRNNLATDLDDIIPKMNIYCQSKNGNFKIPTVVPIDVPILADIKSLRTYGKKHKICPYFLARLLARTQKVVVGSYKYLFYDNFYHNQIVILDEAHNIEQLCKEGSSFSLSQSMVEKAVNEIDEIDRPWASQLEQFLMQLLMFFKQADFKDGELLSDSQFFTELDKHGVFLEHIKSFLEDWQLIINVWNELRKVRRKFVLVDNLKIVWVYNFFEQFIHFNEKSYRGIWRTWNKNPTISWFCLDSEIAFKQIRNVNPKVIILTSGTLSPQENIAKRLGIEEPFIRSYPAVFPEKNIQVLALKKGPEKKPLTTSYNERKNPEIIREYGNTIVKIAKNIPNGTVVFFPSYFLMKNMLDFWEQDGILDELDSALFFESREDQSDIYELYSDEASKNQAVLFAVVRGKLSEGQNFPDEIGRAVIIFGIPYPNIQDPKLRAQREYYEKKEKGMGSKWYIDETFNAINQSLGRAWRHKDDYAMGFLLDIRYAYQNNLNHLPLWIRNKTTLISPYTPFSTVEKIIQNFFKGRK
ncbi:MAG: helicase C-terminal domain-containing protein [Candidatus Helarchaeota archaeon]